MFQLQKKTQKEIIMDIFGKNQENAGAVTLDEIEAAFGRPTQRQEYFERPESEMPDAIPGELLDPEGPDPEPLGIEEAPDEVSPEKAMRTGMRIARLADTGIDFALSNFVAHNDETYRADPKDLEDIAECWGEIAQEHDWNIGPEWQLAILYIMVYGPLVKQALTDRRFAMIEAKQRDMETRIDALEKHNTDNDGNQKPINQPITRAGADPGSEGQG